MCGQVHAPEVSKSTALGFNVQQGQGKVTHILMSIRKWSTARMPIARYFKITITTQAFNNLQANLWRAGKGKNRAINTDSIDKKK